MLFEKMEWRRRTCSPYSSVVEHSLRKRKVGGSIPPGGTLLHNLLLSTAISETCHLNTSPIHHQCVHSFPVSPKSLHQHTSLYHIGHVKRGGHLLGKVCFYLFGLALHVDSKVQFWSFVYARYDIKLGSLLLLLPQSNNAAEAL